MDSLIVVLLSASVGITLAVLVTLPCSYLLERKVQREREALLRRLQETVEYQTVQLRRFHPTA
jgi:hypothetical protein